MFDMLTKEGWEQSRGICDAATPGQWYADGWALWDDETEEYVELHDTSSDAIFIAHARTALPAALDALEALEARADAAEGDAKHWEQRAEKAYASAYDAWANELNEWKNAAAYFRLESDKRQALLDAIEVAVRQHYKDMTSTCFTCYSCINAVNNTKPKYKDGELYKCAGCGNGHPMWRFDQEQFSAKPSP